MTGNLFAEQPPPPANEKAGAPRQEPTGLAAKPLQTPQQYISERPTQHRVLLVGADAVRESRINRLHEALVRAEATDLRRRRLWERLRAEIAGRSAAQVLRMEVERGLGA